MYLQMPKILFAAEASANAVALPGSDVMGFGYDVNGEYARTASTIGQGLFDFPSEVKSLIIGDKEYRYNALFGVNTLFRSDFQNTSGNTIESYRQDLSIAVGVSGGYKLFSASLNTSFSTQSQRQEQTSYNTIREIHKLWQINLPSSNQLKQYMKSEACEALNGRTMPPDQVFETYGATYIAEAIIGGRIDYNAASKTLRTEEQYNISVVAKASYQFMIGEISVDASSQLYRDIMNFRTVSEITLQTVGGQPGLADKIFHGPDNQEAFSEWANSLLNFAVLMDFDSYSLRPIWELVDDQGRKQELIDAFPAWMESKTKPISKDTVVLGLNTHPAMQRLGTDDGSGAKEDLSVWGPHISAHFFYGGQYAQKNHSTACDGRSTLIKDLHDLGYLKNAGDFLKVWTDSGSGKSHDYACWRPAPPPNYRALGDIMALKTDHYVIPEDLQNGLVCVHKSICRDITLDDIGDEIWNDHGTGASHDLSLHRLNPKNGIALGTFIGVNHHGKVTQTDIDRLKGVVAIIRTDYTQTVD